MRIAGLIVLNAMAVLGASALLSGCAARYLPVDAAGHTTALAPTAAAAALAAGGPDTCGAGRLQYLVGRPRLEVPVPADLSRQRVVCSTCVLPRLDDAKRVTILYDQSSGRVTRVSCR